MPFLASRVRSGRWILLRWVPGIQFYRGEVNWGQDKEQKAAVRMQLSVWSTALPCPCSPSLFSWFLLWTCSRQVAQQVGPLGAGGTAHLVSRPRLDYCTNQQHAGRNKEVKRNMSGENDSHCSGKTAAHIDSTLLLISHTVDHKQFFCIFECACVIAILVWWTGIRERNKGVFFVWVTGSTLQTFLSASLRIPAYLTEWLPEVKSSLPIIFVMYPFDSSKSIHVVALASRHL